jgi:hypothetical protein
MIATRNEVTTQKISNTFKSRLFLRGQFVLIWWHLSFGLAIVHDRPTLLLEKNSYTNTHERHLPVRHAMTDSLFCRRKTSFRLQVCQGGLQFLSLAAQ